MIIFPAIDISQGQVVRLERGDYEKKTVYARQPKEILEDFAACGAEYVHAVDLDGAKLGKTENDSVVRELVKGKMRVEIGGGIRTEETICRYLEAGAWRVILGTVAVRDPEFTARMIAKYGEKIAVGIDVKMGKVAIHGWLESSELTPDDLCRQLLQMGCTSLICTDISKDGMLAGTNIDMYAHIMDKYPSFRVTASGGVSTIEDVRALRLLNMYGAIIGKAYYEGTISLAEAIEVGGPSRSDGSHGSGHLTELQSKVAEENEPAEVRCPSRSDGSHGNRHLTESQSKVAGKNEPAEVRCPSRSDGSLGNRHLTESQSKVAGKNEPAEVAR